MEYSSRNEAAEACNNTKIYIVGLEDLRRDNLEWNGTRFERCFDDENEAYEAYYSIDIEEEFRSLCQNDKRKNVLNKYILVADIVDNDYSVPDTLDSETAG